MLWLQSSIEIMFDWLDMILFNWSTKFNFIDHFNTTPATPDPAILALNIGYLFTYVAVCLFSFSLIYLYNLKQKSINNYAYLFTITWIGISLCILLLFTQPLDLAVRAQLEQIQLNNDVLAWFAIVNVLVFLLNIIYVVYCSLDNTINRRRFILQQTILYIVTAPIIIRVMIWPIQFYVFNEHLITYYDKILP